MRIRLDALLLAIAATIGAAASGCSPNTAETKTTSDKHNGAAVVSARLSPAISPASVTRVSLTVTGAGIATPIVYDLASAHGEWSGRVDGIPAGAARKFAVAAIDADGVTVYSGELSDVTISDSVPVAVSILLQQTLVASDFSNDAPHIDGILANAKTIAPNKTVNLRVSASDADDDVLSYAWSAASGELGSNGANMVTWTAPASEGPVTISVTVTDPFGLSATASIELDVDAQGEADVSVTLNSWPVVTNIHASNARLKAGDSTDLDLQATDPDGDSMTYAWSTLCDGFFDDATAKAPKFTLSNLPSSGKCRFAVRVDDGRGGVANGAIAVTASADDVPVDFGPAVQAPSPYVYAGFANPFSTSAAISFPVGPLPAAGGSLSETFTAVTLPLLGTAAALFGSTSSADATTHSAASVVGLDIDVLGLIGVTATAISSTANASCPPAATGSSSLTGLVLDTLLGPIPIVADGSPNQVVSGLPVGVSLVLNEQTKTVTGTSADVLVSAAHLNVLGQDLFMAQSHANIACGAD